AAREDLPDFLVKALIAREYVRFYDHHGVDLRGLARASLRNLKDREFTQGASTLTMQLARNTYEIREKSLHRKFLEIAITLRIEQRYNKEQILTHYLNRIYFGSGAYGIEQAARRYFGKSTRNLSDDECALIVGIIRGPHWFSPLRHPDGALEQRRQTLERMKAIGAIDSDQLEQLNARPLKLAEDTATGAQPSYAFKAVERELDSILGKLGIQPGGLQVKTTLDMAWQQRLERELEQTARGIEKEPNWQHSEHAEYESQEAPAYLQFAAVSTETKSGEVLAWIGGRDFNHSRYDRSRSKRDLGRAFEPFVAAAAAERGKLVLRGKPVQTGRQIGPAEVERLARRCGISGPYQQSEDLFRGAVAASPMEMSIGLATLGNFGKRPDPFLIREIRDSSGKLIYESKPDLTQALSRNAAIDAASVLVKKNGTRCFTGATASERDAWMLRL
ncbi:MAG: transglycosylase domain-containing protein, partial [Luteolibacter sp.]